MSARARRAASALVVTIAAAGCAQPAAPPSAPDAPLVDADGRTASLAAELARADLTVVTFFSAHCPCQRAHDPRLIALYTRYAPRGVRFLAVDAEPGASPERSAREARARGYPFPILADPRSVARDGLGAEAATYTVILDRAGRARYAGGIDSDRTHPTDDATAYVADALDDLLSGREPRRPHGKVLGCALER